MKEIYYVYNNEAIASCIFLSLLNETKTIDIARISLVLPFLLDDRTVNYLSNNRNHIELENLIDEKPHIFTSFNKRYLSLLPVSINSLKMLYNGGLISFQNQKVINNDSDLNLENILLGDRFNKINKIIPYFLSIIEKCSTEQLYKILRIQL
ncbi:three component ABC system middle component [Tenacibaculum halocynthiae]|uniref:three component ABC system middle component n=1 Tax=Tenacibaculum halocynthiae TaxID=1254437 RepID=UPI003894986B